MKSNPDDELLTRKEAALFLKLPTQTLATWASRGTPKLEFSKIGRSVRYKKSKLIAFVEETSRTVA